ncbi:MAG: hypothetical protein HYZ54_00795 [Ignavibacteriae bacterium]|nr:hypothetical protein [Ignavibacteriota bacterium]
MKKADLIIDKDELIDIASRILSPIKPADSNTMAPKDFLHSALESKSSMLLPKHYLIYFLLSDLLKYKDLGQGEKIAWSFPIDYEGQAFLIEYRKFGVGIFVQNINDDETTAFKIASKINRAINSVKPFFDWIAENAVKDSKLNVENYNTSLYDRFKYLHDLFTEQKAKQIENRGKYEIVKKKMKYGEMTEYTPLSFNYAQRSNWLAVSCIEAFFSWTEHLFIHLAIIGQGMWNGSEIYELTGKEWKDKFTKAIPISTPKSKKYYDELIIIRQQLRNFVAHGAFGKNGEAYSFHSGSGSVPILMNRQIGKNRFSLTGGLGFKEEAVIELIDQFINYLWNSSLAPAMHYTQECSLPSILTYSKDGTYKAAMKSLAKMKKLSAQLMREIDDSANMDW